MPLTLFAQVEVALQPLTEEQDKLVKKMLTHGINQRDLSRVIWLVDEITAVAECLRGGAWMPKPIYTAIFLSDEAKEKIKKVFPPRHPNVHAGHVTLVFKPSPDHLALLEPLLGAEVFCEVEGEAFDDRGQAVKVTVPESLRLGEQVHHVTISCAEGVTPVYSNELLKRGWERGPERVPTVRLGGMVRHFTK